MTSLQTPSDLTLNAETRVLWRRPDVVQLELGDRRVIVENVRSSDIQALLATTRPSPTRDRDGTARPADQTGPLPALLEELGFMTGAVGPVDAAFFEDTSVLPGRLAPDRAALTGRLGPAADLALRARQKACVAISGTSRLATSLAATLAAAGVGTIQLLDGGLVRATDACPGGLTPDDEGTRFATAAAAAVRRAAPDTDYQALIPGHTPDLTVLTDTGPIDTVLRSDLHLRGAVHLAVSVDGPLAVLGPLVVPEVSSCLRCADLHRTDRDPAWPLLAVQLTNRPAHRAGSEVALCVATAGLAAAQALEYLDQRALGLPDPRFSPPATAPTTGPATLGATLEWRSPDWQLRRRTWPPHADCDCGASPIQAR